MPFALIHTTNRFNDKAPLHVSDMNAEDSFYTECPSLTAVSGFVNELLETESLKHQEMGFVSTGIDSVGFTVLIHHYNTNNGVKSYQEGGQGVSSKNMITARMPINLRTSELRFSIFIEYNGILPSDSEQLFNEINRKAWRFAGGFIDAEIMITHIDDEELLKFTKYNRGYVVTDRSDLNITTYDELIPYIAPIREREYREHDGLFYAHQTGYQLLETPTHREFVNDYNDEVCEHAFAEPIINLAELIHTRNIQSVNDLETWKWNECAETNAVFLSTKQ